MSYNRIMSIYVDGKSPCPSDLIFATIADALAYVAEMRVSGAPQPVTIRLRDTEYEFDAPVVINAPVCDVTIEPDGGNSVLISGGVQINGFIRDSFNGVDCLSADVSGLVPFTDLYVNGKRASFTRYPDSGFLGITDCENHGTQLFEGSKWMTVDPGDFSAFGGILPEGAIVSFCHYWIDEHSPVESYDAETERLTLAYKSRFTVSPEAGESARMDYYLENVPFTFGKAGDWYLDRSAGRVYLIPRDETVTVDNIVAYAPVASQLISVVGTPDKPVSGIRLRGLIFAYTRGDYASGGGVNLENDVIPCASDAQAVANAHGSITFEYVRDCSMENCRVVNYGVHGVNIKAGCSLITLSHCDFYDGGAGGVRVNGGASDSTLAERTRSVTISDCSIISCGRRYMAACGVLIMNACECTVTHCEIADMFYTGISGGWVWGYTPSVTNNLKLTYNHIHDLGHGALSDMGGVYLLGMQPGTVVSNNVIHDVASKHYGGWALYTDEGSSYITMENNVCWNCSDNVYHQHYGSCNTIRNNIFAFAGTALVRISRYEEHLSICFERNLMLSRGEQVYQMDDRHFTEGSFASDRNAYFTLDGSEPVLIRRLKEIENGGIDAARTFGIDMNSVTGKNPFANAERFDFTVDMDDHAVKTVGFKKIDTSTVGVRK